MADRVDKLKFAHLSAVILLKTAYTSEVLGAISDVNEALKNIHFQKAERSVNIVGFL